MGNPYQELTDQAIRCVALDNATLAETFKRRVARLEARSAALTVIVDAYQRVRFCEQPGTTGLALAHLSEVLEAAAMLEGSERAP